MKTTQLSAQALVNQTEQSGLHYIWEHDVEGDVIEGSFNFPVLMERGDRVIVDLEGESTTLTVLHVVYNPSLSTIQLKLV